MKYITYIFLNYFCIWKLSVLLLKHRIMHLIHVPSTVNFFSFRVVKYSTLYLVLFIIIYFNSAIWSKHFKKFLWPRATSGGWTASGPTFWEPSVFLFSKELNQFCRINCCESFRLYEFLQLSTYIFYISSFLNAKSCFAEHVLLWEWNSCVQQFVIVVSTVWFFVILCNLIVTHILNIFSLMLLSLSHDESLPADPEVQCSQPRSSTNHPQANSFCAV